MGRERSLPRSAPAIAVLGIASLLASALLAEGVQTGVISGTVTDSSGIALEGVDVTLFGAQASSSAQTDAAGRFRFPGLAVGIYGVEARLLGLAAQASSLTVSQGRTTELRLELAPGAARDEALPSGAGERIVVVAEPPILDRYDSRVATAVRSDFLARLPVERFYQSVALVVPGLAGGGDGNPNASGALRSTNLYLIDGVDTTDSTTGLFGLNLAYGAIEEVNVTTAGAPAAYGRAPGAVIQVVTRSGGNDWRGSLEWLATNNSWNDDFDYPAAEVAHLTPDIVAANSGPEDVQQTVALAVGGPVTLDRLWFFAAYEEGEHEALSPTRDGASWNENLESESFAGKLTLRASVASTLVGQLTTDQSGFTLFSPFNRGPSENRVGPTASPIAGSFVDRLTGDRFALERRQQEGSFAKLQWNAVVGQDFTLALGAAEQERHLSRSAAAQRGLTGGAPHAAATAFDFDPDDESPADIFEFVLYNGITDRGEERRRRRQANLATTGFFDIAGAEHEFAAGLDYRQTISRSRLTFPGTRGTDRATGRPVDGQFFLDLDLRDSCRPDGSGCVPFDPASGEFQPYQLLQFYSREETETREQTYAAYLSDSVALGRLQLSAGIRFESVVAGDAAGREILRDDDFLPRASVVWDSTGRGTTLFSASYALYVEPFLQFFVDSFFTAEAFSGYSEHFWDFGTETCSGADPRALDSSCWIYSSSLPQNPIQGAPVPSTLERAMVDEFVVGLERQITERTAVSVHYVRRNWRDEWDNVLTQLLDDAGEPAGVVSVVRNLSEARRTYQALQLLLQKRLADRWQLLASYTRSETLGNLLRNDGFSDFSDYGETSDVNLVNRYGPAPFDQRHQAKLFALVDLPARRVTFTLGTAIRYESGVPYQRETQEPLGRRFLERRGTERLREVFQADLSLSAATRFGAQVDLLLRVEAFNLTAERRILGVETLVERSNFGQARSLQDLQKPRAYRLSLGLRF